MKIHCERIGTDGPALVLVHGLAANGAVWRPLLGEISGRWPGRILVPDLRGHGRSAPAAHYDYGQYADDIAELLEPGERAWFVGHSLGAVVALLVASGWFGVSAGAVLGFATKLTWSEAEIAKGHALAKKPVRWFDSRPEAAGSFLRFSGLAGLVTEDAEVVEAGLREEHGRWRLAADPWTFSTSLPPSQTIFRSAQGRIILAGGSKDPMVTVEELRDVDPQAIDLPGLGHNLHVERPQALAELIFNRLCPLLQA